MHTTGESITGTCCWQEQDRKSLIVFQYSLQNIGMDPGNFNHIIKESYIHFEFPVVGYGSNTYMTSTKKHLQKLIHYLKKVMLFIILAITLKLYSTMTGHWLNLSM
jgi:hypothetical protein